MLGSAQQEEERQEEPPTARSAGGDAVVNKDEVAGFDIGQIDELIQRLGGNASGDSAKEGNESSSAENGDAGPKRWSRVSEQTSS